MNKPTNKTFFSKKYIILILAAAFFILAFVLPWLWPDGAGDFSGAKGIAARRALEYSLSTNGPGFTRPFLKVIGVEEAATDGLCNEGFNVGDGSSRGGAKTRYAVTIEETYVFGIGGKRYVVHICEH
jgi:hypothetical protein